MRRTKVRKKPHTPTARAPADAPLDADLARLAPHGDWVVPVDARRRAFTHRLQRDPVADQLYGATPPKISPAEWQATLDFTNDYELAQGARDSGARNSRVDGGGKESETAQIAALGRRRRLRVRIGAGVVALLDAALGEGISRRALAQRVCGATDGAAYKRLETAIIEAIRLMAGTESRKGA